MAFYHQLPDAGVLVFVTSQAFPRFETFITSPQPCFVNVAHETTRRSFNTLAAIKIHRTIIRPVGLCASNCAISPAIIAGRIRFEERNFWLITDLVGQGGVRDHIGVA